MANTINIIEVNNSISTWQEKLFNDASDNDSLIFYSEDDDYLWFTSQFTQLLCRNMVDTEVVQLFGRQIKDLKDFIYQINFGLPIGYRMKANLHALYDSVLNFETEPAKRFVLWNDADYLLEKNRIDFVAIFETLTIAAYVNRKGLGTVKENGSCYLVDQRNFFFFNEKYLKDLDSIISQKYYIPPLQDYRQLPFNRILLK